MALLQAFSEEGAFIGEIPVYRETKREDCLAFGKEAAGKARDFRIWLVEKTGAVQVAFARSGRVIFGTAPALAKAILHAPSKHDERIVRNLGAENLADGLAGVFVWEGEREDMPSDLVPFISRNDEVEIDFALMEERGGDFSWVSSDLLEYRKFLEEQRADTPPEEWRLNREWQRCEKLVRALSGTFSPRP